MKRNIYSLFLALIAMAAFTACSSDDHEYQWATASGEQVYFSKDLPAQVEISNKENSFTVPVSRVNTSGSVTVNISLESEDNFLSAPSSVTFAEGASTANLVLSYNPEDLVYDQFKSATLSIASTDLTNEYGKTSYSFSAGVLSPYKTLGNGVWVEDYLWGYQTNVTIAQNTEQNNVYRIYGATDPVNNGGDISPYLELTILNPGDVIRGVTVTQPDLVFFADYNSGYHHGTYDADVMLYHPSIFTNTNPEEFWLHSKVLAYKEDGTPGQIQLAPRYYMEGVGGWNASQTDGAVVITFPGYAPKDYSAEFAVTGVFTDLSGAVFAEGILGLGADAQDVRAAIVGADADAEAVADAIAAGEVETTALTAGNVYIPIPEGTTGKLQVVVVVFDEEGAVKGVYSSAFEYYGGGANPWVSIGTGLYTEDFVSSVFGADPITYEVEIEENTETPGLYRMIYPYGEVYPYNDEGDWDASSVYNVEVDASDPEGVIIYPQNIGIDWGYGPMAITSMGGYYASNYDLATLKEEGMLGTLVDGVITLPVFERDTDDGKANYQGLVYMGTSGYYAGSGAFQLVLPEAVSDAARKQAAAKARARRFAKQLFGEQYSLKNLRIMMNRKAPLDREQIAR